MWLGLPRIFRFEICHPFKTFIIRDIPSKNQDSPSIWFYTNITQRIKEKIKVKKPNQINEPA
jgi:hypothetical protein